MTNHQTATPGESLLILGAGAVGCAAALAFARRGFRVTVVDRDSPGSGCSHGNAGGLVPQAAPLGQPNMPLRLPGLVMDRHGPLSIRPARLVSGLPWFLGFLRNCTPARAEANSAALYALSSQAAPAWRELVRGGPGERFLKDVGWLKVYTTDAAFHAAAADRGYLERRGAPMDILSADEVRQLEPNLARDVRHGVLQPDAGFATDPRRLVEAVADEARTLGAVFVKETARHVSVTPNGWPVLTTDSGQHSPDRLMLCAGAFSGRFADQLGGMTRLEAERGYHAMFDTPDRSLNRPVVWAEKSMVLCPMTDGVRLTCQAEFAGLDAQPNFTRLNRLARTADAILPSLHGPVRARWMGHRPSTPDGLPYLGFAPATPRAFFNFGHNHLGLTLAAVCARIAADAWAGDWAHYDLTPYRALR